MPERTPDGRYIVVDGRRWRAADPALPDEMRQALTSALGRARAEVRQAGGDAGRRRARRHVQAAKEGLGERGTPWWELPVPDRLARAQQCMERLRQTGQAGGSHLP